MKILKLNFIVLLMLTINFAHSQEKTQMKQMQTEKAAFVCPMQCEGEKTYEKAGSCPKCKMDLKKVDMKMKAMYVCPMHAAIKSDKPGACPKCGMHLKKMEMKKDSMKMNMDHSKMEMSHDSMNMDKSYACPMHSDEIGDKPGSCTKCGMDLKKKEIKK